MAFEHYIRAGQRLLRCGYTTGTCAALAAQGAVTLLLTGEAPKALELTTPKGIPVSVAPLYCRMDGDAAVCAVEKDGGDDADVTDGISVVAAVRRTNTPGLTVDGGAGVGRVTKPGLDQSVGAAAINHVPRRMIEDQVRSVCEKCGYTVGLAVVISVPGGEEIAKRTFNPQLGVVGGISILGTSGIVEPMSERALADTIELELRQAALQGKRLILTPGNYGMDYVHAQGWDRLAPVVKCANFIGDALDAAAQLGFSEVLFVGHIGKLVKLAAGIMNTHSRYADGRAEVFCAHAALAGADRDLCRALMDAATADAALLRQPVLASILTAVQRHLDARVRGAYAIGAAVFSNQFGQLGHTDAAGAVLARWRGEVTEL